MLLPVERDVQIEADINQIITDNKRFLGNSLNAYFPNDGEMESERARGKERLNVMHIG